MKFFAALACLALTQLCLKLFCILLLFLRRQGGELFNDLAQMIGQHSDLLAIPVAV